MTIDLRSLEKMAHSPVRNYVVPGLTSWLIGAPSDKGCMRLFTSEREHLETVIPHSHRFDFQCWVLRGTVRNRVWKHAYGIGDWFMLSTHTKGRMGGYEVQEAGRGRFDYVDTVYSQDEWYSMTHSEIHSIWFGRGAKVLFFEGPQVVDHTTILEPIASDTHVRTFKVEPWMFERDA